MNNLRDYEPKPVRKVNIKKNGKLRAFGIPTMTDRALQEIYLMAIDPILECISDKDNYGFRRCRTFKDAILGAYKKKFRFI